MLRQTVIATTNKEFVFTPIDDVQKLDQNEFGVSVLLKNGDIQFTPLHGFHGRVELYHGARNELLELIILVNPERVEIKNNEIETVQFTPVEFKLTDEGIKEFNAYGEIISLDDGYLRYVPDNGFLGVDAIELTTKSGTTHCLKVNIKNIEAEPESEQPDPVQASEKSESEKKEDQTEQENNNAFTVTPVPNHAAIKKHLERRHSEVLKVNPKTTDSMSFKRRHGKPKQRHRLLVNPQELGLTARIKTALLQQDMGITQRIKKAVGRDTSKRFNKSVDTSGITAGFRKGDITKAMGALDTMLSLIFLLPFVVFGEIIFQGLSAINQNADVTFMLVTAGTWKAVTIFSAIALLWITILQKSLADSVTKQVSYGWSIDDCELSIIILNISEYIQRLAIFLVALGVTAIMCAVGLK